MAAEVSSLIGVMNGGDAVESGKPTVPITRDLLGGCCAIDSKELDLDSKVPCGWEKRLDLKSGKVYLQRRQVSNSSSSTSDSTTASHRLADYFHSLNFPPSAKNAIPTVYDDDALDLKLVSSSALAVRGPPSSVCTLDKVKSALEMAERDSFGRKRSLSISVSKSSSNSSSSVKGGGACDNDQEEKSAAASFAAGCPGCLLYVLVSRSNPKCPRCNCNIRLPSQTAAKKPRIDLNMSI